MVSGYRILFGILLKLVLNMLDLNFFEFGLMDWDWDCEIVIIVSWVLWFDLSIIKGYC